jgi:uncharacterized protein YoxC|tara:strand:- start:1471 stop:1677 length:207 start_codon:yes stop_codon:yes gene_type:complete
METALLIVIFVGVGITMLQIIRSLNRANARLKSDLNTIVRRCENLTKMVRELQEEIVKMESRQQLVEK